MGDVFDAMNRAKRERSGQPQSNEIPVFPAPTEPTPQPDGDTKPALPIDEVRDQPDHLYDKPSDTSGERHEADLPQPSTTDPTGVNGADAPLAEDPGQDNSHDASLNGYSAKIVVHHDRGSAITEQYRAIRTQILARSRNRRLQTHVITSSLPGEGKSVTCANLGVSFSELRNQQTLLIEGDLRRPSFHSLFDRECTPGLKLLQLLILGQPELRNTLKHPRLEPLIQRIVMYTHLKPMDFDTMTRYIAFRLVRAGKGRPNVDFSREALRLIYEYSTGIPRLINLACDNALLVGYSSDTLLIDSAIIRRAISQMLPNFNDSTTDITRHVHPPQADGL